MAASAVPFCSPPALARFYATQRVHFMILQHQEAGCNHSQPFCLIMKYMRAEYREREREKTATSAPGTYAIASKGSKPEPRSRGSLGSPTPERMFLIALTRLRKNNANLPELQTQGIFRRPRFGPTCKLNSAQRIQRPQQPKNRTRVGGRPHDTANYSNTTSQQRGFGKCSSERPAPSTLFPFPCKLPRPPDGLPG